MDPAASVAVMMDDRHVATVFGVSRLVNRLTQSPAGRKGGPETRQLRV